MSKPTNKVTDSAPRRVRFPRFRDFRVRSKLGLILAVPITAIVTLSAINLVDSGQRAVVADNVNALAQLSADASDLIHHVQSERTAAVNLLTEYSDVAFYKAQYNGTDVAAKDYEDRRNGLGDLGPAVTARLKPVDDALARLPELRAEVAKGRGAVDSISVDNAVSRYGYLIENLLAFRDVVWQTSDDSGVTDEVRAAAAFSRAKEYAAVEQTIVLGLGNGGQAVPAEFRRYQGTAFGQQEALREFFSAATPVQRTIVVTMVRGTAIQKVERMEGMLNEAMVSKPNGIQIPEWIQATTGKLEQMRAAEQQLDQLSVKAADTALNVVRRQVIFEAAVVLTTLLVAVVLALIVARSMVRSLRQLREAAIGVAYEDLPKAVARLRDPEIAGEANPETIAAQLDDPLQVRGRDEFGQVAQAFNVVHREAVRVAAEQAVLRANVSTMFVNLARRSQTLVDRLIGHLDRLEKGEEDPDRLAALFQLDHLATRMRRNDENLLVLAGADSTRVQRDPAPLGDVLRAAQSEVEHYTRIEFGVIERDIEVTPHAINDLVHLVAELFDNATAFSPPDTAIVVDARRLGDRAIIQVEDRGIGISAEQIVALNERLANPPLVDVAVSRMMGLVVVARLGHRHAIKVELQPARDRGIVAQVLLPADILAGEAPRGNTRNTPAALPAAGSAQVSDNAPARGNVGSLFGSTSAHPAANGDGASGFAVPDAVPSVGSGAEHADADPSHQPGVLAASADPDSVNGSPHGAAPRSTPAWHDFTGATASHGQSTPTLPSRRPGASVESSGETPAHATTSAMYREDAADIDDASGQVIPRQLPSSFEVPPAAEAHQPSVLGLVAPPLPVSPYAPAAPNGQVQADTAFDAPRGAGGPGPDAGPPPAADAENIFGEFSDSGAADAVSIGVVRMDAIPMSPAPTSPAPTSAAPTSPAPTNAAPTSAAPTNAAPIDEARREHVLPTAISSTGQSKISDMATTPTTTVSTPGRTAEADSGLTEANRVGDDGEELLIFREMESVWFSTGRDAPELAGDSEPWSFGAAPVPETTSSGKPGPVPASDSPGSAPDTTTSGNPRSVPASSLPDTTSPSNPKTKKVDPPVSEQEAPTPAEPPPASAQGTPGSPAQATTDSDASPSPAETTATKPLPHRPANVSPTPPPGAAAGERWQTVADRGWQAATAAAVPEPAGTTSKGLPKRVPMAQLVPGGVVTGSAAVDKRNPEAVRGLLSAYHRGVQRGRKRTGGEVELTEIGVRETSTPIDRKKTATQHTQNGPSKERNA